MKISHEFIPYEQALELKELGFDEPCLAFYDGKGTEQIYFNSHRNGSGDYEPFKKMERITWFGAPLYQQAFRWFREKYSINSWIINAEDNNNAFKPFFRGNNIDEHLVDFYNTYEEAELARLKKLIEIAKNK